MPQGAGNWMSVGAHATPSEDFTGATAPSQEAFPVHNHGLCILSTSDNTHYTPRLYPEAVLSTADKAGKRWARTLLSCNSQGS